MVRFAATLVLGLLTVALFAAAQPPGGPGPGPGGPHGEDARGHWQNMSQERRQMALQFAEQRGMFARCAYADGQAEGRFVSFDFDEATGSVSNYTVHASGSNQTFLEDVQLSAFSSAQEPVAVGSVFTARANEVTFVAHNNPVAIARWHATEGVTLTITLAEGVSAPAGTAPDVRLDLGDFHGHLLTNATAQFTTAGSTLTTTLTPGETVLFVFHPASAPETVTLHARNQAFVQNQLGATVRAVQVDGEPAADQEQYRVDVRTQTLERSRAQWEVEAELDRGQVVFLTVTSEILDPSRAAAVRVLLDGESVERLENAEAVLASTGAAAAVVAVEGQVQIVVNVPTFSTHTITAEQDEGADGTGTTTPGDEDGTPGPGALAVLAVLGIAGFAWRARRRDRA